MNYRNNGGLIMRRQQERGVVLIVALIILLVMTTIGLSASRSTSMQEKIAGNLKQKTAAFLMSEAALTTAESWLANDGLKAAPGGIGSVIVKNPDLTNPSNYTNVSVPPHTRWWDVVDAGWWKNRKANGLMPNPVNATPMRLDGSESDSYYAISLRTQVNQNAGRNHVGASTHAKMNQPINLYDIYGVGTTSVDEAARDMAVSHFIWTHRK